MILALREDNPVAEDYTYFNVVEIDLSAMPATPTRRASNTVDAFVFSLVNNFIYQGISANMPRRMTDDNCIMRNLNYMVDGQRVDSTYTPVTVGERPADWGTNVHYCGKNSVTGGEVYLPVLTNAVWQAAGEYYRDDSTPDNRLVRLFYTDNNFSFSLFNFLGTGTNDFPAQATGIARYPSAIGNSAPALFLYPYFWGDNGSTLAIDSNYTMRPSYTRTYSRVSTDYYDTVNPVVTFFAHLTDNDKSYIAICICKMSADADDAYPIEIWGCAFNEADFFGASVIPSSDNMGTWGDPSKQAGGTGTFDDTTDSVPDIAIANLPSILNGTAGFIQAYRMDSANLYELCAVLFNPQGRGGVSNNLWTAWVNYKFNPIAGIISLHLLPAIFTPAGVSTIVHMSGLALSVGNVGGNGVQGFLQSTQYADSPVYSISIAEYFGSRYDYAPHTKMRLHLPFCGVLGISPNDCNGGSIAVKYRCDIFTGNVGAKITTTNKYGVSKSFVVTGNCAYTLPIVGRDTGMIDNLRGLMSAGIGALSGNAISAGMGVINAAENIAFRQERTYISGDVSSSTAPVSDLALWLEIERPEISTADKQRELIGIPSNITAMLETFRGNGFVKMREVHIESITEATETERAEIERLLKNGVIM